MGVGSQDISEMIGSNDVLMLATHDWANTGWRFFKCLQSLGLDILALKGKFHPFYYPEQIPILPVLQQIPDNCWFTELPVLSVIAKQYKVIHYISNIIDPGNGLLKKKKVVIHHGGSLYRQNAAEMNEELNQYADITTLRTPDLMGLGAINEVLMMSPVDTEFIRAGEWFENGRPLRIGHCPSVGIQKGTQAIQVVIQKWLGKEIWKKRIDFCFEPEPMPWPQHLRWMSKTDIIVDALCLDQDGKPYGEWGNTALEAAALGKIVITHSLHPEIYEQEYQTRCPFLIANTPEQLCEKVKQLLHTSGEKIRMMQREHRIWAETHHSMKATAKRFWEKVYQPLLVEDITAVEL